MPKKPMKDERLAALVAARVEDCAGGWDSLMSKERQLVQRFYDQREPAPVSKSDVKYTSADVYEGVQTFVAQMLETFAGTHSPIRFTGVGAEDQAQASAASIYIPYVVMRQNPGYANMSAAFFDSAMNRNGITKVVWESNYDVEEQEPVRNISLSDFEAALAQDPEVEIDGKLELDPADATFVRFAKLTKRIDRSQVRITPVAPEEFGITKGATCIETADTVFQRAGVTADALIRMGVDEDLVAKLTGTEGDVLDLQGERAERFRDVDGHAQGGDAADPDDMSRIIEVTEAYCRLDLDGRPKTWRVLLAEGKVLTRDVVRRHPFYSYAALPRNHSFWGDGFAARLMSTQTASTYLTRSIVNQALVTNNPRWTVLRGGVNKPAQIVENKLNSLVEVNRPDAIAPMMNPSMNPFVFQTLEMLKSKKEESTGISSLSTGLNKDAISKQNSADMVDGLIGRSMTRQKVMARNFLENYLKPLWLEVYRLTVENANEARIKEIAPEWSAPDPARWPHVQDIEAEVEVGYGDRDKERDKWLNLNTMLAQDTTMGASYDPQRRYFVYTQAAKASGIRDINSVLADPSTLPPPEPSPADQAQMALLDAQNKVALAQAQAMLAKIELDKAKFETETQLEIKRLQLEDAKVAGDLEVAREKIANQRRTADAEIALAEQAQASGNLTAIASPT